MQCMNLSTVLSILSSNDQVIIEPSQYVLELPFTISDISNISFTTTGKSSEFAEIKCQPSSGLTFNEVNNLVINRLIFTNCETTGDQLETIVQETRKKSVNGLLEITIPLTLEVGLVLASCNNVTLNQVTVRNTSGVGLLGLQVLGHFNFVNSTFEYNQSPLCLITNDYTTNYQAGGGVYLYYHDTITSYNTITTKEVTITINHSIFHNNQGCSQNFLVSRRYTQHDTDYRAIGYRPGDGGLSLVTAQRALNGTSVHMTVDACTFTKNRGRTGSGISIMTLAGTRNTNITIRRSLFKENGFESNTRDNGPYLFLGGAICIILDALRIHEMINGYQIYNLNKRNLSFLISESNFDGNSAYAGGAIYLYSYQLSTTLNSIEDASNVFIDQCTYLNNSAVFGGVLYLREVKDSIVSIGTQVLLKNVIINGTIVGYRSAVLTTLTDSSSAVQILTLNITVEGNTAISHTVGSGIRAEESNLNILGSLSLTNNNGVYGGGIQLLEYSAISLERGSSLIITDNNAIVFGGAIYFGSVRSFQLRDCFIFSPCNSLNCSLFLNISGNTAPLGNVVYGSTLETCPWASVVREYTNVSESHLLLILQNILPNSFIIIPTNFEFAFSTPSDRLEISAQNYNHEITPGDTLHIHMEALDELNNTLPVSIASQTSGTGIAQLGNSGYWFLDLEASNVPLTIKGNEQQTVEVIIYTTDSFSTAVLRIQLVDCTPGYMFNDSSLSCDCIPELTQYGVGCNPDTSSLTVPNGKWFGLLDSNDNATLNNLVVGDCHLGYCDNTNQHRTVINGSFDVQCRAEYHRSGLFCGSCQEGYSITLVGPRCKMCSNWWIIFVVFGFFLSGALLVIILTFLNINITVGFINGFIFYENIGHLYQFQIFPSLSIFYPFEFVNLSPGFEICFFNQMTAIDRQIVFLIFPLYLFILMGIVYVAARCFKCSPNTGSNITKTFVTLIILCYIRLLETSTYNLGPIIFHTLSGERRVHWLLDPSVVYFSGIHSFCVVVSVIIILFYIIPAPIALLNPPLLYKMKYVNYFKPILDAFWAPFKPQFRFWLGLKLLLRLILFVLAIFVPAPLNLLCVTVILFIFLMVEVHIQPFQGIWQNRANTYFTANITLLLMVISFFSANNYDDNILTIVSSLLLLIAYLALIPISIYHILLRWPKLLIKFWPLLHKRRKSKPRRESLSVTAPSVCTDSNQLRESLLNYEDDNDINELYSDVKMTDVLLNYGQAVNKTEI